MCTITVCVCIKWLQTKNLHNYQELARFSVYVILNVRVKIPSLNVHIKINAAIAAFGSIQIKTTWPRIEPWTFCTQSRYIATQLLRIVVPMLIIPLYLKQIECNTALNKCLLSVALNLNHCLFSCY